MVKYHPDVIQQFAERLYGQAGQHRGEKGGAP